MVSDQTQWPAPAKLNLFLHVTGRRADGYHELQTLFQLIDLSDTVSLTVREDGLVERPSGPAGVDPDSDLTVRAAKALKAATGCRLGRLDRNREAHPHGWRFGWGELGCCHGPSGAELFVALRPVD